MTGAFTTSPPRWWTDERVDSLEVMYCLQGLSIDEIALLLGSTPAAVRNQINFMGFSYTPQAIAAMKARGEYWRARPRKRL